MVQVLALMMVLLFGIFLGIDTAEQNMHRMQGSAGAPRAVHITPDEGQVEISVLGHVYETESPVVVDRKEDKEKKEKPKTEEEKPAANSGSWLAQAGNQTGTRIKDATRKIMDRVAGWIAEALQ